MSETAFRSAVQSHESVDALCDALSQKGQGFDVDLYPRDGSRQLYAAEQQAAILSGVEQDQVVLQNTGMTAIKEALDVAVEQSGTNKPTIAYAGELYAKTTKTLFRYAKRHGINLIDFDSGSTEDIEYIYDRYNPDIVISETVSNGPHVPVLDHEHLLELSRAQAKPPVLILDHTLPLSSGYDVFESLHEEDKALVVVSGTKAYALNAELAGLTFVKNPAFREALQSLRCDEGGLPGVGSTERISELLLPISKEAFDDRNRRIYANTGKLAVRLFAAQNEPEADFTVHHPVLPTHADHEYAAQKNNGDITPVFYIRAKDGDQIGLAKRLENHPDVISNAEFGQSFGFNTARILPDAIAPVIRIAGGAYTDTEALGNALYEAILTK